MSRHLTSKTLLAALLLAMPAAMPAWAQTVPRYPTSSAPDPLHLPDNLYLGEVSGIALNSKGHVFVFHRGNTTGPAYAAAAAQLLEFDEDGNYVREIGRNLYAWSFAHTVKVDAQDNIWVTDKGSDMVIRFNPQGRVTLVFGRKQEASDEDTGPVKHPKPPLPPIDGYFRQVTDITWDSAGNGYISDGYINSRVAKIGPDGAWLGSFGTPGDGPASSTRRTASPWTPRTTSTSPTAATGASRCSTPTASCCARSRSTCRTTLPPSPRSATGPTRTRRSARPRPKSPARPGPSASRRRRTRCCMPPTRIRAASTS